MDQGKRSAHTQIVGKQTCTVTLKLSMKLHQKQNKKRSYCMLLLATLLIIPKLSKLPYDRQTSASMSTVVLLIIDKIRLQPRYYPTDE